MGEAHDERLVGFERYAKGLCCRCGERPLQRGINWCAECSLNDDVNPSRVKFGLPPFTMAEYRAHFHLDEPPAENKA